MAVIYPDIEAVLVSHLQDALGAGVRVATKKVPAGDTPEEFQVVVVASMAQDIEPVTRLAGVVLDCYAPTDLEATELALTAEAHLRTVTGSAIKSVRILRSNVRLPEEADEEKRSISAEVVVKASNL